MMTDVVNSSLTNNRSVSGSMWTAAPPAEMVRTVFSRTTLPCRRRKRRLTSMSRRGEAYKPVRFHQAPEASAVHVAGAHVVTFVDDHARQPPSRSEQRRQPPQQLLIREPSSPILNDPTYRFEELGAWRGSGVDADRDTVVESLRVFRTVARLPGLDLHLSSIGPAAACRGTSGGASSAVCPTIPSNWTDRQRYLGLKHFVCTRNRHGVAGGSREVDFAVIRSRRPGRRAAAGTRARLLRELPFSPLHFWQRCLESADAILRAQARMRPADARIGGDDHCEAKIGGR